MNARAWIVALACILVIGVANAVEPDEKLADSALEARAMAISQHLRCVVCQNQNIDDSAAPLARDMRLLVRARLQAGDSDEQAMGYLVARYGNFVLLKPPLQNDTLLLWFGPFAVGALAVGGLVLVARARKPVAAASMAAPLNEQERARLRALLARERPPETPS